VETQTGKEDEGRYVFLRKVVGTRKLESEESMSIVEEGHLKGSFQGFKDRDMVFEFQNGHRWVQAEYKYSYYYAYSPKAQVIEENGQFYLEVDGMNQKVQVKRASSLLEP